MQETVATLGDGGAMLIPLNKAFKKGINLVTDEREVKQNFKSSFQVRSMSGWVGSIPVITLVFFKQVHKRHRSTNQPTD